MLLFGFRPEGGEASCDGEPTDQRTAAQDGDMSRAQKSDMSRVQKSDMSRVQKLNLKIWDSLSRPPREALKTITGGRLKGFTDVNPQWRYKAMTEAFGPIGYGWTFSVERLWTEPATNGEVFAFAKVSLRYLHVAWSEPIEGYGGSKLIAKEGGGLHSNDEAYKMAITDALGTAMKMIGVASAIYEGFWDGSKYTEPQTKEEPTGTPAELWPALDSAASMGTEAFRKAWAETPQKDRQSARAFLDVWKKTAQIADQREFVKDMEKDEQVRS